MALAPLDAEIAARTTAAVDAALTALRARPPAECDRCGSRGPFTADHAAPGWWRCPSCYGGTYGGLPSSVAEAEAREAAERDARRAVIAAARARVSAIGAAERRDYRPLTPALVRGMHEALLHRAAPSRYPATRGAAEWLDHVPLVDLCRKHLELGGHPAPFGLSRHAVAMRALVRDVPGWVPTNSRASGYHATKDLPALLDDVGRTVFLDAYEDAVRTFPAWTTATTVADFKSTYIVQPGFPALELVAEHGEYQLDGGPLGPAAPLRVSKYGRVLAYTREAVLRDDVPALAQVTSALGVAAADCESDAVYDLLVSNPKMADGFALFSTQHANLMTAAALDAASLATATAALAAQTASGHALHLRAAFLLVGAALGATARTLVTTMTPANATADSGTLTVVEDGRIAGKTWYLTCDPRQRPTIVTAHLTGADGPDLLAKDGWDVDARLYKGRDEFGAAAVDHRSMVLNPGV